jgi:hypothetical protein
VWSRPSPPGPQATRGSPSRSRTPRGSRAWCGSRAVSGSRPGRWTRSRSTRSLTVCCRRSLPSSSRRSSCSPSTAPSTSVTPPCWSAATCSLRSSGAAGSSCTGATARTPSSPSPRPRWVVRCGQGPSVHVRSRAPRPRRARAPGCARPRRAHAAQAVSRGPVRSASTTSTAPLSRPVPRPRCLRHPRSTRAGLRRSPCWCTPGPRTRSRATAPPGCWHRRSTTRTRSSRSCCAVLPTL